MDKMHILVTGGCGFIGSNFVRYMLSRHPHAITNMDDLLIYLEENTSPGQTLQFSVLRSGGQQATLPVTLGVRPETTQPATGG